MPTIILKKTFRVKTCSNEKSFSFHGGGITRTMIDEVNRVMQRVRLNRDNLIPDFQINEYGHYYAIMNRESPKYHEEDFVVAIFDVMETMGYTFRFQYDTEIGNSNSVTSREMFVFQKTLMAK